MAIDLNAFKKNVEKCLPILFLVEENNQSSLSADLVASILETCLEKNIHTEFMLFSFGSEWTLKFPKINDNALHFANLERTNLKELQRTICEITPSNQTFLGSALKLSKAILDDPDVTKPGRYKPVVIIIASKKPVQGWEDYFVNLLNNGRSANAQVYWLNECRNAENFYTELETILPLGPFSHVATNVLRRNAGFDSAVKAARESESSDLKKRFENVIFKNIGSRLLCDFAKEIVSSFRLEPLDEAPTEDPVEFTAPGIDGDFGDGANAKGDGVV